MAAESNRTFSESWYRIGPQRVALRPQVRVRRQFFRGRRWYVLEDPFNNQFFRLTPEAWDFVARLRRDRTVEEAWTEALERDPDDAPGQEDVIQLLAQLYHANLLQYDLPGDSVQLFERYRKRRGREIRSTLQSIMFARFPLLDPDAFLKRTMPLVGWLISPVGAVLWIAVVATAVKVVIDRFPALVNQSQGILAPSNLPLLYLALVVTKGLHEFGHAYICRKFGGEVHTMGIMLLIFTPIPYMDATSSWAFRSRWRRAVVGAAGMIVEIFVAALATFAWAATGSGVVHALSYNMMFIASVSTVLFNANPLLRFDGYYILSDLLDIPNLHAQASQQLRHLVERYAFGYTKSEGAARSRREAVWLVVFGILSGIYRVVVFTGIILFVADRFLLAGLIMAVICVVSWGIVPAGRLIHYLAASPRLERTRPRAIAVVVMTLAVLVLVLRFIPAPSAFRAPGVVQAERTAEVITDAPGRVTEVLTPSGAVVRAGEALVLLADPELAYEAALSDARLGEAEARRRRALQRATADLAAIDAYIDAVRRHRERLDERQRALVVRAPLAGQWVAPILDDLRGAWLPRGTSLGRVVDDSRFEFTAVVPQKEASRLFSGGRGEVRDAEVRLRGEAGRPLEVVEQRVIPAEQEQLPTAALGWFGGGDVAVSTDDASGMRAAEPFFLVIATVALGDPPAALLHGRSGLIRFRSDPEPLLLQWSRRLRQLLQRRYGL